jgi:hypothetical protein
MQRGMITNMSTSMQFYFVLILIHRPLIHMSVAQQAIANSSTGTIDSATVCTLAAVNIAKLVRDYQQFYSLKRISSPAIHFTFIAATIHIVNSRLLGTERHRFWLQGCVSALNEMGDSYPIGRKAVRVLRDLMARLKPDHESQCHHQSPDVTDIDPALEQGCFKSPVADIPRPKNPQAFQNRYKLRKISQIRKIELTVISETRKNPMSYRKTACQDLKDSTGRNTTHRLNYHHFSMPRRSHFQDLISKTWQRDQQFNPGTDLFIPNSPLRISHFLSLLQQEKA